MSVGGGSVNAVVDAIDPIHKNINSNVGQLLDWLKFKRQQEEEKRQFDQSIGLKKAEMNQGIYNDSRNRLASGFDALAQMRMGAKKDVYGNY